MIDLNPYAISGLLIVLTDLPLFLFLILKVKTKISRIYALHIFSILWWGVGCFLIATNKERNSAMAIWNFAYAGVILIPVFFQHVILILTNKKLKLYLAFIYIQAFYFLFKVLNNQVFINPKLVFNSFYFSEASTFLSISFAILLAIFSFSHWQLLQFYRHAYPEQKKQILFLFLATLIGFLGGITNYLPHYKYFVYPYGNFTVTVHSLTVSYAILKYQFLEIEVILRRSLVYSILIGLLSLTYLLIVLLSEKFLQGFIGYHSILISVLTAFLLGIILVPLRNKIQYIIDRIFFKGTQVEIAQQNELLRQEVAKTEKLKAVATLASGMAHEIKNPLTPLKTFSEALPQKLDDKEFLKKFASILGHEVDRIDHLVNDLLDFARPAPLQLEKTNIHGLLIDTLNLLSSQFIKNKINVIQEFFTEQPITLEVDPHQLKQAFLNLFLNSIDAMPNGGTLTIRTSFDLTPNPLTLNSKSTPKILQIIIKDTGHGIAPDDLPHIFDPFFTKKDSGTGLGLSVTHGIMAQHGGGISVESRRGEGAAFIVELPLKNECIARTSGNPGIRD